MARSRLQRMEPEEVPVHVDEEEEEEDHMDESRDPLEESGYTMDESEEEEVDASVAEDMEQFERSFKGISQKYRLINRIGEGTFSTVYKAEDLLYDQYLNDWDVEEKENRKWSSPQQKRQPPKRKPRYVAIKKIYVTSSPLRILNELELLHDLRNQDSVCPLITAFRDQDQVIAILPYFQHHDFREYFREFTVKDMQFYFRSLFTALRAVHELGILHRDIKPTNFLYSPRHARGVLVDFGLAERQGTDYHACVCEDDDAERAHKVNNSVWALRASDTRSAPSYPKADQRPSRRANRAGTRGFRAPEVLFKCTAQTTAIDMWSAGVILLTLLARRFPFFHSADDIDALLELTNIFGRKTMRRTALLHGQVFETNIPSYNDQGYSFEKIVLWATNRSGRDEHGNKIAGLEPGEKAAIDFLERCLDCDPRSRITADEALEHPFIVGADEGDEDGESVVDLVSA